MAPRSVDLYSVNADGVKDDAWIMEELLGADDVPQAGYVHNLDDDPALLLRPNPGDHPLKQGPQG